MPIYEIGQFIGLNLEPAEVVAQAFFRLQNRELFATEAILMAVYAIDTYGTDSEKHALSEILEASPLEEEVIEYRMAA